MKNIAALITIVLSFTALSAHASQSVGTILTGFSTTKICQNVACSVYGSVNWLPTINANTPGATAVSVTDSGLSGNLWGDEIGWVNLSPAGSGVTINPATGALSGSAFANTGGWINFRPTQVAGNPTVGVTINTSGEFEGYAYVSGIKGGWMKFDCTDPLLCIKTDWRPTGARTTVAAPASSVVGINFLTPPATTPGSNAPASSIIISDIRVSYDERSGTVSVEWTTDAPSLSQVTYRTSDNDTPVTVGSNIITTVHSVSFSASPGNFLYLSISAASIGKNVTFQKISFQVPLRRDLITPSGTTNIPVTMLPPESSLAPDPYIVSSPDVVSVRPPNGAAPTGEVLPPAFSPGGEAEDEPVSDVPIKLDLITRILGLVALLIRPLVTNLRLESLMDARLAVRRMFGVLTPRRRRIVEPWGTVYDSLTKRPLDPVYVSLRSAESDKEISGAITDLAGRYGFLVPPGEYKLTAMKTHYDFPSTRLRGKQDDIVYDKLYFGENFTVGEKEGVVLRNIPLDAVGTDWNEEEKKRMGLGGSRKRRQIIIAITNTIFVFGFLFSVYALLVLPDILNAVIVFSYVVIWTVETLYDRHFRLAVVIKRKDGKPLPFALVKILLTNTDILIKKVVADQMGKFYILMTPGSYRVVVEERISEDEYRKVYEEEKMDFPKGIFLNDVIV